MRFMIIVKASKDSEAGVMPEEKLIAEMAAYHEELAKAGVLIDGSGLQASSKGWRIKYSGAKRTVIDGPFTETKELIAGYTMIKRDPVQRGAGVDETLPQSGDEGRCGSSSSSRTSARARRSSASAASTRHSEERS